MLFLIALVLGVVSGLRSMVSPAAVSWAARLGLLTLVGTPLAFLGFAATPFILTLFALCEILNASVRPHPVERHLCNSVAAC